MLVLPVLPALLPGDVDVDVAEGLVERLDTRGVVGDEEGEVVVVAREMEEAREMEIRRVGAEEAGVVSVAKATAAFSRMRVTTRGGR